MQKQNDIILLAQKMLKDLEVNYLPDLELVNLHTIFRPVYKHNLTILNQNAIVAFVIFAYSEESPWLNVRQDRLVNKKYILSGIGVEPDNRIYKEIIEYQNDAIQQVILNYLLFCTDSRWREIISLLEYHDKMFLFCNQRTVDKQKTGTSVDKDGEVEENFQYIDQIDVAKINKEKGELMIKAIEARQKAETLLKQLESDYQKTDHATQSDFGFQFSDVRKYDPLRWEDRIRRRKAENKS
jgi:hypothetical protein